MKNYGKLYLHIGSPKTGSTSIQEIFSKNRRNLEKQNFIYPGRNPDHHFLYFASKAPREKWPRHFKGIDINKLKTYINRYFSELEKGFREKQNVIMSTEYIFFDDQKLVENIMSYLQQFFSEIKVICFLRRPVDYYKSYQQQLIKGQSYIQAPQSFKYKFKSIIETWESVSDSLQVFAFNKGVNSFVKLCDDMGVDTTEFDSLEHRTKGSVSTEQMLLLEKVYKNIYQSYDNQLTGKLHVKAITQINADFTHRPELKENIIPIVYENHREDLEWLKENHKIDFLQNNPPISELSDLSAFEDGKATVRDIYKVQDEASVEKYEALVIDVLLKNLVKNGGQ